MIKKKAAENFGSASHITFSTRAYYRLVQKSKQNIKYCSQDAFFRLGLDPNFGVPKYTVTFRLYLVIIVQPLTN
jgi:hypothetical protein